MEDAIKKLVSACEQGGAYRTMSVRSEGELREPEEGSETALE